MVPSNFSCSISQECILFYLLFYFILLIFRQIHQNISITYLSFRDLSFKYYLHRVAMCLSQNDAAVAQIFLEFCFYINSKTNLEAT